VCSEVLNLPSQVGILPESSALAQAYRVTIESLDPHFVLSVLYSKSKSVQAVCFASSEVPARCSRMSAIAGPEHPGVPAFALIVNSARESLGPIGLPASCPLSQAVAGQAQILV
jgi:hypothetical protein